jgi:hypothetical protein
MAVEDFRAGPFRRVSGAYSHMRFTTTSVLHHETFRGHREKHKLPFWRSTPGYDTLGFSTMPDATPLQTAGMSMKSDFLQ